MNRMAGLLLLCAVGCTRTEPTSTVSPQCCQGGATSPASTPAKPAQMACCMDLTRSQFVALLGEKGGGKSDSPMFGGSLSRNMANTVDKGIPLDFSVEEGDEKRIKWQAELGSKSYGGPVIAEGKVLVGTNNATPRDKSIKGKDKAILMCFNEADGKFLWQSVHETPVDDIFKEVKDLGLLSTPAVDSGKAYYVLAGGEVICTDMANGKTLWTFDMMKDLKVVPYHCCNCSPLVVGKLVYVITGNSADEEGKVANPKAPSFLALDKDSGKVVWQSNLPGEKIMEGQWSNPVFANINGKPQVIFPGGDSTLYSLEPDTGKLIWQFHCHPKREKKEDDERHIDNYIIGTPVVYDNKVYVGLGVYPEHPQPTKSSYVLCVDATRTGDVSPGAKYDPADKKSALVWAYGGPIEPRPMKGRPVVFGRTISTCAVHDGLVFIPEENGYLHCLDAKTGQKYWDFDFKAGIWGSPYYVDGKVLVGTQEGTVYAFAADKEKKQLAKVELDNIFDSTPVVANGVLYLMVMNKLYAIK